jgi:TRAP-type uncharacterized transport system substrate-binding protein
LFRSPLGIAILLLAAVAVVWVLFTSLVRMPNRELAIATGPPGSAYAHFAEEYRDSLAREGVRLRLVPTNGAVENIERLRDPKSGISVGFVQAGTTSEQESPQLVSLGTVFYEPLWVFCRCTDIVAFIRERPDLRISIGPVGSATRPLALRLLSLFGIDLNRLQLRDYASGESAEKLLSRELDVALILSAWESPAVQQLLREPGIELIGMRRADAYVALQPNFTKLVLPEGVADLRADLPPRDVTLIAAKASLVVRVDLHPALQYLLLRAAIEAHSAAGVLQKSGEFPAPEVIDLPISEEARHMYKSGPSILQRTLPFWLAELVQRLLIIVLPVAGILYPLWSLLPKLYRWQMQGRIYRLYGELRIFEMLLRDSKDADSRARLLAGIEDLERRVLDLRIPRAFSEMSFNLRAHVRALRERARASV